MKYTNNQYIKLDLSINEISKIKIKIKNKNKSIENLEIKDINPKIIICYGKNNFDKIFTTVKTIITDDIGYLYNKNIPEFIENVIINKKVFNN